MDKISSFEDLQCWQEARKLDLLIYQATVKFPRAELFTFTSQMRRAAISISSNIAEGFVRWSVVEKIRFFNIASGSLAELRSQLILSADLDYIDLDKSKAIYDQTHLVGKLITGLARSMTRNRQTDF